LNLKASGDFTASPPTAETEALSDAGLDVLIAVRHFIWNKTEEKWSEKKKKDSFGHMLNTICIL